MEGILPPPTRITLRITAAAAWQFIIIVVVVNSECRKDSFLRHPTPPSALFAGLGIVDVLLVVVDYNDDKSCHFLQTTLSYLFVVLPQSFPCSVVVRFTPCRCI